MNCTECKENKHTPLMIYTEGEASNHFLCTECAQLDKYVKMVEERMKENEEKSKP